MNDRGIRNGRVAWIAAGAAVFLLGAEAGRTPNLVLALKPEKLASAQGETLPSYQTLTVAAETDGRYALRLAPEEGGPTLAGADLSALVPRVPRLALGSAPLTRIALIQREFNRNEIHNELPDGRDFSIANNCLKQGLWEVKLSEKRADKMAMRFHAWFTFPRDEYARLFERQSGLRYADYENLFAAYPTLGGIPVPLADLRTVVSEKAAGPVSTHAAEPLQKLPEQESKTKYILSEGVGAYGNFADSARQPIALARFSEPGYYDPTNPARFDLSWLSKPVKWTSRLVRNPRVEGAFPEVEVAFADGKRILVADSRLGSLPVRTGPPEKDADVLKVVCGIGTPDIHASAADRVREVAEDRPRYLMILDAQGNHVDNHLVGGVDGVYLWRDADALHLWLVGYERIALVAHLSAPWSPPPAEAH